MRALHGVARGANFVASSSNAAVEGIFGQHADKVKKVGTITAIALASLAVLAAVVIAAVYLAPLVPAAISVLSPYVAAAWAACAPALGTAAAATGSALATAASAIGGAIATAAGATSSFVMANTALALKVTAAVALSGAIIGYLSNRNTKDIKAACTATKNFVIGLFTSKSNSSAGQAQALGDS